MTYWLLQCFSVWCGWSLFPSALHLYVSSHVTDSSWCVCVALRGALIASFIFLTPVCFQVLVSFSLHLTDWEQVFASLSSLGMRQLTKRAIVSVQKKRTAISGGVSLNDLPHIWVTCSVAASFHPTSQRRTKECHQRLQSVRSPRKTGDKINSSLEWNYCRTVSGNFSPCCSETQLKFPLVSSLCWIDICCASKMDGCSY